MLLLMIFQVILHIILILLFHCPSCRGERSFTVWWPLVGRTSCGVLWCISCSRTSHHRVMKHLQHGSADVERSASPKEINGSYLSCAEPLCFDVSTSIVSVDTRYLCQSTVSTSVLYTCRWLFLSLWRWLSGDSVHISPKNTVHHTVLSMMNDLYIIFVLRRQRHFSGPEVCWVLGMVLKNTELKESFMSGFASNRYK